MARKPKNQISEDFLSDDLGQGMEPMDETLEKEIEDVEETQELSFGDESYNRLGEIPDADDWN